MSNPEAASSPPPAADIYCRRCRCVLTGLDLRRCPDCGQAFDPHDPNTLWGARPPARARPFSWPALGAGACLVSLILSPALIIAGGRVLQLYGDFTEVVLLFNELILGGTCGVLAIIALKRGPEKSRCLAVVVLVLLLPALMFMVSRLFAPGLRV
jgi:hypothetical protein